jgi:CHAD domain-containing protein
MAYRFAVGTVDVSKMNPAVLSIHLLALLEKVSARAGSEDVHRLRTTVRRLEVQLGDTPAKVGNKSAKNVAKSLKSLRRKAGKVRDIDVHLVLLKPSLRSSSPSPGPEEKPLEKLQDKLRRILKDERDRQFAKLRSRVTESAPLLESHLPALVERAPGPTAAPRDPRQQVVRASRRFLHWTEQIPADDAGLHQLRIKTKKLRYSLEPLLANEDAAALVAKFKQVQDAIGKWHDWLTLEQLAARYLDPAEAAPLRDALHDHSQREYRHARRTAQSVRSLLGGAQPAAPDTAHKSPKLIRKAG